MQINAEASYKFTSVNGPFYGAYVNNNLLNRKDKAGCNWRLKFKNEEQIFFLNGERD